jgi:hypothetical protein
VTSRGRARVRQRASQRAALNRPRLSVDTSSTERVDVEQLRPQPERVDWPAIVSRHPRWWQVERVERRQGRLSFVLVAECETEDAAMRAALRQASQARVWRRDERRPPWFSFGQPRDVSEP